MKHEEQTSQVELWLEERFQDFYGMRYRVEKTLYSGRSEFQKVDVVETTGHGKMLLNDGLVMVTERDEYVYHEMMAHVPLFCHPNPRRVLVIGGGDGGTVREVIRHPSVEFCQLVEIDPLVLEACQTHIPLTAAALKDPKVNVLCDDGLKFVAETNDRFDVVLIDSTDPIGPAAPLFGPEFYRNVKKVLRNENGIVVSQGESPFYHLETQKSMLQVLKGEFANVSIYNFSNLSYPGGLWSFTFASDKIHPIKDLNTTRIEQLKLNCQWYNTQLHKGAFAIPEFMRQKFKGIIADVFAE